MGRWDALKSDPDPKGQKRAPQSRVARIEPRNGSQLDRNVSAHARLEKYASLRDECCNKSTREFIHVDSLAQVVATSLDILPAEEMARDVVQGIFLPFLEAVSPTTTTTTTERQSLNAQLAVFHAIHSLLKNRKHASAVMAPLVNDVTVEGNEDQVANPIRCRMFRALQQQLLLKPPTNPSADARPWEQSCQCLTRALQEASLIDGTKHHAGMAETDIEVGIVRRFLSCTLAVKTASGRLQKVSLELLHALIQRHPESSSALATSPLLLMPSTSVSASLGERQSPECSRCGYTVTSHLLGLVHESHADRGLAMECTADLLHRLPLHLWLQNERQGRGGQHKLSQSTFQEQVSDGLLNAIRVARCCLDRVDGERHIDSLVHLIKVILLEIPYEDENDDLHKMASLLVKESLALLLDDTQQRSTKLRDGMTDVLVECMGGHVTPQGQLTSMVSPMSSWLGCVEGQDFIRALLLASQEQDNSRKVLKAVVRSSPQSILTAGATWDLFRKCVGVLVQSRVQGFQLAGLQLVEAMLRGRKDFGSDAPGVIVSKDLVSFVAPILHKAITSDNSFCKCAGVAAYGSLVGIDWAALSTEDGGCLARVRSILLLCDGGGKANAKVRSETCKTIGDMCAQYFSAESLPFQDVGEARLICDEVCVVVERLMKDTVASVRSMALYAAGNLAQSLRNEAVPLVVDPLIFSRLMLRVRDLMDDPDDKVTGNAIRSVAHVVCLLLREDHSVAFQNTTTIEPGLFLNGVVKSLAARIRSSVSLARGGESKRSWKERTAVKKHGWGASNSLATIFCSDIVMDDAVLEACQDAVAALVECLEALQVVHEKVALSSMAALRSVQPRSLSRISGKTALVGRAVIACLVSIHNTMDQHHEIVRESSSNEGSKCGRELNLVLWHLVTSCSIADAHAVLLSDSVTAAHLGYLYQWMVRNDCSAGAFDSFAIAMQRSDVLVVDVQVEQRFASRAMSLLRIHDDQGDDEL